MSVSEEPATINIEGTSYRILCGESGGPITVLTDAEGKPSKAACRLTGEFYDLEEVAEVAKKHATDEMQLALNRQVKDAVKGSGVLNFTGETVNSRSYKFVVDLIEGT